ncbi:MAG TPA: hypothetical protein VLU96_03910 [Gaiellaceae bacterium]|nr:hypothetical protein [Gaiellaceae bacterium]
MNAVGATSVGAPEARGIRGLLRRREPAPEASFPELVWVHHLRQQELRKAREEPYGGPAERRYQEFKARFERENGKIVSAYWCTDEASAVALTIKRRPMILPDVVQLHWATNWSTNDKPKLMALLYRCESLSVRVHEVLRDTSQRLAMQALFTLISYILAFSETDRAHESRAVGELERTTKEQLKTIESYYRKAAVRSGQIVYVAGMLLGMVPVALVILLAIVLRFTAGTDSPARIALLCFAAGSVGALVSVMSRMTSNKVSVDWEFGKDTLRTLGSLRPFVGGVFGLITFFALKSGVIALDTLKGTKGVAFYIVFAFAAGFSERLAQDMLLTSTVGVGGAAPSQKRQAQPDEQGEPPDDEVVDSLPSTTPSQ